MAGLTALLFGEAAGPPQALQKVAEGNRAFTRGQYTSALDLYEQAEERITDPGLVAFNEGTALYRLGRYRQAVEHFTRCLDDARGERRARALYNRGNTLVRQAAGEDAKLLERAIRSYEDCLREPTASSDLLADARANLALARTLLAARAGSSAKNAEPNGGENGTGRAGKAMATDEEESAGRDIREGEARDLPETGARPAERATSSRRRPLPGTGNLPPIPEQEKLDPLSPEQTAEYIREVVRRIERERRDDARRNAPLPVPGVKDW
jgi:Ca-activated chloride channel family protein